MTVKMSGITVELMPYGKMDEVKWEDGITVGDLLRRFRWISAPVYVLVNGVPAAKDKKLKKRDKVRLFLLPIVAGG